MENFLPLSLCPLVSSSVPLLSPESGHHFLTGSTAVAHPLWKPDPCSVEAPQANVDLLPAGQTVLSMVTQRPLTTCEVSALSGATNRPGSWSPNSRVARGNHRSEAIVGGGGAGAARGILALQGAGVSVGDPHSADTQ